MVNYELVVGNSIKVPFTSQDNSVGETVFDIILLRNGEIYTNLSVPPLYLEIGQGLYTCDLLFTETGEYTVYLENTIVASIIVKNRTLESYLANIEDGTLGSWSWDKEHSTLTLYRITGGVLATYTMTDTDAISSRERT